jgi:wobble nucleotide-excising tRNase
MITKIHLENIASYQQPDGLDIDNLEPVNFFFGTNGSGKTTISKLLRSPDQFDKSSFQCSENTIVHVYNEDFKNEEVFETDIKGVFTLGADSKEIEEKIKSNLATIEELTLSAKNIQGNIEIKKTEKSNAIQELKVSCWDKKREIESWDVNLKDAFHRFRGGQDSFYNQLVQERNQNTSKLLTKAALVEKSKVVFGEKPVRIQQVNTYDFQRVGSIENDEILNTEIVGKENVTISELINKLGNSDWVKSGKHFLNKSGDSCPFCQQQIDSSDLSSLIEEYFDDTYIREIEKLDSLEDALSREIDSFKQYHKQIKEISNLPIDRDDFDDKFKLIIKIWEKNILILEEKKAKPSTIVKLEDSSKAVSEMQLLIEKCIENIIQHNLTVDNYDSEKSNLISQVWRFTVEELKQEFAKNDKLRQDIDKAIQGMEKQMGQKQEKLGKLGVENEELELKINSLKPTISEINKTLKDFGYHGFQIQESQKSGYYSIVRSDNSDARKSLSEGEKTFISFLYFYYRVNGLLQGENIGKNKVIVIDDPISSLDNNIIFVVSSMIKKLIKEIENTDTAYSQIFVFTHNIFFHKEVTYASRGVKTSNRKYWIIRKKEGESYLECFDDNPILSSYKMMWKELETANQMSVCNIMRRILETYFQFYGDTNLDDLPNAFEGDQKLICRSLISWIHDGSHNVMDDLFYSLGDESVEKYQNVFKEIFDRKGHLAHYNMMININKEVVEQ